MSAEQNAVIEKPVRRWFSLILKIVFFVSAFFLVIFTVMANMGGNSDALKSSIEEFVADNTGYYTTIRTLNRMTFFPRISVDFEGLEMYPDMPTISDSVIYADKVKLSFSFWDVFFSTGRVQVFYAEGISALAGVLSPRAVGVEKITILDHGDGTADLTGNGYLGEDMFSLRLGMDIEQGSRYRSYGFAEERPFEIAIADLAFKGVVQGHPEFNVMISDFAAGQANEEILTGVVYIDRDKRSGFNLQGDLKMSDQQSMLQPAVRISLEESEPFISGVIASPSLDLADFSASSKFAGALTTLRRVFTDPEIDETVKNLSYTDPDIRLDLEKVYKDGRMLGRYEGFLPLKDGLPDVAALADGAAPVTEDAQAP